MKFSIHQVTFNDNPFVKSDFDTIETGCSSADEGKKITDIKKTYEKKDRFVAIYFNTGNKFPYTPEVVNSTSKNLDSEDNPRTADQIELTGQLFVLFDVKKQMVYLSDYARKGFLKKWLGENLNKAITIKSSISEEQFLRNLKTVERINLTVEPSVFTNEEGALSESLAEDIHNFEAKSASIKFSFDGSYDREHLKRRIRSMLHTKENYKRLVIAGRSDDELESVFNAEEIVNKIAIKVDSDKTTGLYSETEVFDVLITKIENHETP